MASACSTDSVRLSQAFNNPFSASERVAQTTPSAPTNVAAVPTSAVHSQALAPVQSARAAPAPVTSGSGGWMTAGGTRVTVATTDTLNTISQRYGVPASAILTANGLNAGQVTAGRQIVIPVYNASAQPTQIAAPRQPASEPKAKLAEVKPAADKPADTKTRVRPGMTATAAKTEKPAPTKIAAAPAPVLKHPEPVKVAARVEPQPAKVASAAPVLSQPEPAKAAAPEPEQTASLQGPTSDFRWPARGRVILGFGGNGGNEGINIAVPEGTPVKAAEAGTITYAGSEVKGYGNLVLIRHDNGYVTAYAHNGDLSVKRGEKVKRGQVIATSGQSGNVTSPQLHFELRKGQSPVDPTPYLSN